MYPSDVRLRRINLCSTYNNNESTRRKPDDMAEEPEELRAVENCAGLCSARFVG
jgi:hypothetical protein